MNQVLLNFRKVGDKNRMYPTFHKSIKSTTYIVTHNLKEFSDFFMIEEEMDKSFFNIIQEHITDIYSNDV